MPSKNKGEERDKGKILEITATFYENLLHKSGKIRTL